MIQYDIRRKEKGACVFKVGRDRFDFDRKEEFVKYKYLCCESMKKKEWKKCNDLPYSYCKWSQEIKNKYVKYNLQQLEELKRYLELCIRKKSVFQDASNLVYAALTAAAFTMILDKIVIPIVINNDYRNSSIVYIIVFVLVLFLIMYIVHSVLSTMKVDSLEKYMYCDYKEIIEEVMADKRKEMASHQN